MIMKNQRRLRGAIDMGTTKVAALVAEETATGLRVIGVGLAASDGLRQGVVTDIERAAECVVKAVRDATRMAGVAPKTYNVGSAGEHIRSMNSRGVVSGTKAGGGISPQGVMRALDAA